jgi:hypothetical protein
LNEISIFIFSISPSNQNQTTDSSKILMFRHMTEVWQRKGETGSYLDLILSENINNMVNVADRDLLPNSDSSISVEDSERRKFYLKIQLINNKRHFSLCPDKHHLSPFQTITQEKFIGY